MSLGDGDAGGCAGVSAICARDLPAGCGGFLIVEKAVPAALAAGQPGTPEFRVGLRDAIRSTKDLVGTQGVFTMSRTDHNGTDMRAQVLVQVKAGKWTYVPRE